MGEARERKSKSPHTTALMASFSVLLTGSAVGTYFVQLRGEGWHAMLSSNFGPELVIVCGAMAALAVVVHLSVARALGVAQSAESPRIMLRRALEVLDTPAFDGTGLEDLPDEVRDLVETFAAQKSREQQVERELQAMHRSTRELVQRLEQSGVKLEALTAEPNDELAMRVARAWNPLIEQVRQSREPGRARSAAAPLPPTVLFASEHFDLDARVPEAPADVARRLGELETNLSMLWNEMRGLQTIVPEPLAAVTPVAVTLSPASQVPVAPPLPAALQQMSDSPPMPTAPSMPMPPQMHAPHTAPALVTLPETRTFEALQEVSTFAAMPEMLAEPEAIVSPWSTSASRAPAVEPLESASPSQDIRWATSEVLQPDRSTKASVSGYFEWTGQSTQLGSWKLRDEAPEELRRGAELKAEADAALPPAFVDDTYPQLPPRTGKAPGTAMPAPPGAPTSAVGMKAAPASPAAAGSSSPSFESHFPHFVGKTVQQLDGRVEVSFEGTPRQRPETRRTDGSARPPGLEAKGAPPVFDLRTLGALEIDE